MSTETFFNESTEQSQVKSAIVSKYFLAWARVIKKEAMRGSGRIAYLDLFAGPGRYKDGSKSTPLLVLEKAIADPDLRKMLVTVFNDADSDNSKTLEKAISELEGVSSLKFAPKVHNFEVGTAFAEQLEEMRLVPTLFFVDPWGYKGLSLRLVNSVLKDWGCDGVFFFNYNRINMGLGNPAVVKHMDALFGEVRGAELRAALHYLGPLEREATIVEELASALKEMGGRYVLPFRFRSPSGVRTSHHLIFVSKHPLGYEIMKEVMAKESTTSNQGVPSFEYNPAILKQGLLFELSRPLDELGPMLLEEFAGEILTMKEIYKKHHVDRRFIKKNYKNVLTTLESEGKVVADPPAEKRPRGTFADQVKVKFLPRR